MRASVTQVVLINEKLIKWKLMNKCWNVLFYYLSKHANAWKGVVAYFLTDGQMAYDFWAPPTVVCFSFITGKKFKEINWQKCT